YLNHEKKLHEDYIKDNSTIATLIKLSNISDDTKKKFENQRLEILYGKPIEHEIPKLKSKKQPDSFEDILFNELKKEIENIKENNAEKLTDYEELEDKINESRLSNDKVEKLHKLRKNKLAKFANNKIKQLENKIKISKTVKDIDYIFDELIYDKILSDEEKDNITTLSQNKLEKIKDINEIILTDLNNDILKNKILTHEQIQDISASILEKITKINENNKIYDEIKTDIDRFLIPENLYDFIKENINTFDKEYLSNNKDKLSLNKYYMEKQEKLIKEIIERENNYYIKIILFSGLTIKECKIAINNRWNEFQIINKYVEYREFRKINIIEVQKSELYLLLDILEDILNNDKTTFKFLPKDYKKMKIDSLNDDFLPCSAKQNDLRKAISDKKNTFRYRINELNNEFNNDGLDPNRYEKILKSINETEEINKKFTGNIINNFEISGTEIEKIENEFDKSLSGVYKLSYIFDLIIFDSEKLKNVDKLAADAKNYHNSWLQYTNSIQYKYILHEKEGELPYMVKNRSLALWINNNNKRIVVDDSDNFFHITDDIRETSNEISKSILSILQLHYLVRYIAYKQVVIDELHDPHKIYNDFEQAKFQIKEKLIDKENTIIIFDKAHFPNTSYQVIQPLVINKSYKVLVMSAIFPNKKFSISTSKHREVYIQPLSVVSIIQQICCVGHLKLGKAFLTTQKLQEIIPDNDIIFYLINAAIALPYKKDHPVEAIIVNLNRNPKPSSAILLKICSIYNILPKPDIKIKISGI
ncbi:2347_t:CDS:2, partial [Scutellospora calospora]